MTPRAWATAFLDLGVLGWYAIAVRLLIDLYPATTWVLAFSVALLVLVVALSVVVVRESVVLWALLWDAGFRGALAKAERNAKQDDADLLYTQGLEAQLAAARIREQEKDALINQQAEELKVLRPLVGRRKEDKAS